MWVGVFLMCEIELRVGRGGELGGTGRNIEGFKNLVLDLVIWVFSKIYIFKVRR